MDDNAVNEALKMPHRTSIIMLSYNTLAYTRLAITSVLDYTEPGTYELIVIDNASTDGSREYLQDLAEPGVRVVLNERNAGFPGGCNQGMQLAAPASDLLLLNSDVVVTPHWLTNMQRALHSAAHIGAVGCVTNKCSNGQQVDVAYAGIEQMLAFAAQFNQSDEHLWFPWLRLIGFCLLIRHEAYEAVGGLDERCTPGWYDDYSFTLRQAGYSLVLAKDTFIHHFGGSSFDKVFKESFRSPQFQRNADKLQAKWQVPPAYNRISPLVRKLPVERLCPGTRVLVVNAGWGGEVYYLQSEYPWLEVRGLTGSRRGEQFTRSDIQLAYVGSAGRNEREAAIDIAAVRRAISGQVYNEIVLLGNAREMPDIDELIAMLMHHLVPGGHVRYGDTVDVYEQVLEHTDAVAAMLSSDTQRAYSDALKVYDIYGIARAIVDNMLKLLLSPADDACGIIRGGYKALAFVGLAELQRGRPFTALAYLGAWMRLIQRFQINVLRREVYKYMGIAYACLGRFRAARTLLRKNEVEDDENERYLAAMDEAEQQGYHALALLPCEPLRLPRGDGWRDIPIFINSRDRVTCLKRLVDWLLRSGYRCIYILDNDSTYPPLLDYYDSLAQKPSLHVVRLPNLGHRALWRSGILDKLQIKTVYAYTDSDVLPIDDCPADVLRRLFQILQRYPFLDKVGLGIEYQDITFWGREKEQALHSTFYKMPLEKDVYFAPVDTTLALYRPIRHYSLFYAARTTGRLWLRHLPWYLDRDHLPEEERYYMEHANGSSTLARTYRRLQTGGIAVEKIKNNRKY